MVDDDFPLNHNQYCPLMQKKCYHACIDRGVLYCCIATGKRPNMSNKIEEMKKCPSKGK